MKCKAHELEFISQINRDGSGTIPVPDHYIKFMTKEGDDFELRTLSLNQKIFIAFNFNAFIVKLKPPQLSGK